MIQSGFWAVDGLKHKVEINYIHKHVCVVIPQKYKIITFLGHSPFRIAFIDYLPATCDKL